MINKKIGNRFVEKARDSISDANENVGQNSTGSKSFLGDIISSVIDIVGDVASDSPTSSSEDKSKGSGRKPGASADGRVGSVGSRVADQLKRKK